MLIHGNTLSHSPPPHPSYQRFLAVMDVLGMKEWLRVETAQAIAERMDGALAACAQTCSGSFGNQPYGPLLGTTHFSDTLLLWSPDDSWASFATICSSAKLIVAVALEQGVPLRGAISVGEAVCSASTMRFVGPPLAEAYLWAEDAKRPYRSVGVDITPSTTARLLEKLERAPLPSCWQSEFDGIHTETLRGDSQKAGMLMWFRGCLFLNHWSHGIFTGADPVEMFLRRNLPVDEEVRAKASDLTTFFQEGRAIASRAWANDSPSNHDDMRWVDEQGREYLRLDRLRQERHA